jgi:hypothetical protein
MVNILEHSLPYIEGKFFIILSLLTAVYYELQLTMLPQIKPSGANYNLLFRAPESSDLHCKTM